MSHSVASPLTDEPRRERGSVERTVKTPLYRERDMRASAAMRVVRLFTKNAFSQCDNDLEKGVSTNTQAMHAASTLHLLDARVLTAIVLDVAL
jgi:hypothetical protein